MVRPAEAVQVSSAKAIPPPSKKSEVMLSAMKSYEAAQNVLLHAPTEVDQPWLENFRTRIHSLISEYKDVMIYDTKAYADLVSYNNHKELLSPHEYSLPISQSQTTPMCATRSPPSSIN